MHLVTFDLDLLNNFLLIGHAVLSLYNETFGDALYLSSDRCELVSVILHSVDSFLLDHLFILVPIKFLSDLTPYILA